MHKAEVQSAILSAALNSVLRGLFRDPDMPAAQWRALRQFAATTLAGLNPGDGLQAALAAREVTPHVTKSSLSRLMQRMLTLPDGRWGSAISPPKFPISDMALTFVNLTSECTLEEPAVRAPGEHNPMHQRLPSGAARPSGRPGASRAADRQQDPMHQRLPSGAARVPGDDRCRA